MITIFLILGLFSTMFVEKAVAKLQIIEVHFIDSDSYYIDYNKSSMNVHPTLNDVSIILQFERPFPDTATFDVQMFEQSEGDLMYNLGDYSTPLCKVSDKSHKLLPKYLIEFTKMGYCGVKGKIFFEHAGIYKFKLSSKMRNIPHTIINSNEITDGDKIILKYDVVLENSDIIKPEPKVFNLRPEKTELDKATASGKNSKRRKQ